MRTETACEHGCNVGCRLLVAIACAKLLSAQSSAVVNVVDFGALQDGTDAVRTTAAFMRAFAAVPVGRIVVPSGNYLLDNTNGAVQVQNFGGELAFQGGARLLFINNTKGGLWFTGGTGARVRGLRAGYQFPPVQRNSPEEEIKFIDTTDTWVNDAVVSDSPAAGILFYHCIRPKVTNALVQNTLADGLHFANCQDAQAANITTLNTGDDGLAFLNYSIYPNLTGGVAYNINVTNSRSRGISVVGQSNVSISNFQVNGTASSGILCAYDSSYNTRVPSNVSFASGTIANAGTLPNPLGNQYGIEYNSQASCSFSDIAVTGSAGRGLGGMAPNGSVAVNGVRVSGNRDGEAFSFFKTAQVQVSASSTSGSPAYGFFFGQCGNILAKGLSVENSSQTSSLHRAIWFENNQSVVASDLNVVDSQTQATGYVVGASESTPGLQTGLINGITSKIVAGRLAIQNNSENVRLQNVSLP